MKNITKIFTLLLFSSLFLNFQVIAAPTESAATDVKKATDAQENTYNVNDDFNFNDSSYYVTDEQLEAAKSIDKIDDDNAGFLQKLINSSHFSSDTATKTWIPINKVQE